MIISKIFNFSAKQDSPLVIVFNDYIRGFL